MLSRDKFSSSEVSNMWDNTCENTSHVDITARSNLFLEHSWQFFAPFLYGASVHLNLDRRTPVHLSNRVIAFNQSKCLKWFRRIPYFSSLRLKWQCSKRNGACFSCASIEFWMHLGKWESTREAREAPGFASCHSNASLVLSQLPACIQNSIDARQAWTVS